MKKFIQKVDEFFACAGEAEYIGIDVEPGETNVVSPEPGMTVPHTETGAFQAVKSAVSDHGKQTVRPDDCEFGDNDLCFGETQRQCRHRNCFAAPEYDFPLLSGPIIAVVNDKKHTRARFSLITPDAVNTPLRFSQNDPVIEAGT